MNMTTTRTVAALASLALTTAAAATTPPAVYPEAVDYADFPEIDGLPSYDHLRSTDVRVELDERRWLGAQLYIALDTGSFYRSDFGNFRAPPDWLLEFFPQITIDSYITGGGHEYFNFIGGSADLREYLSTPPPYRVPYAATIPGLGDPLLDLAWAVQPGHVIFSEGSPAMARITLTDDATGHWSFYMTSIDASGHDYQTTLLLEAPIHDGQLLLHMPEPGTASLVVVALGAASTRRRAVSASSCPEQSIAHPKHRTSRSTPGPTHRYRT